MSSLFFSDAAGAWHAPTAPLSLIIRDLNITNISLVKIDCEGAEALILPTVGDALKSANFPPLFVATHQPFWPEGRVSEFAAAVSESVSIYR